MQYPTRYKVTISYQSGGASVHILTATDGAAALNLVLGRIERDDVEAGAVEVDTGGLFLY